jgi:hypothetical protein
LTGAGATASEEVRAVAAATGSQDPEVGLAAVAALRGLVEVPRRHRRIADHVGLPDGYRGAAGPLLGALGVELEGLRRAVMAEVGKVGS